MKRIGVIVALVLALATVTSVAAYTVFSVNLGSVKVQEPLQISVSADTPLNQKLPSYPGDTWMASYRVTNASPVDYHLSVWTQWDANQNSPSPYVNVDIKIGEKKYRSGEPIEIRSHMSYVVMVILSIPKSSPPGTLTNLSINFERTEAPDQANNCTLAGGCG